MPDLLQPAPSGRAKCRGCGRPIAKGELRFGESAPNPYGEGETHAWFHVACGALMRPEKLLPALEAEPALPLDERPWLTETARRGLEHHRVPRLIRAERASSGRAHCRSCRELIDKGAWRFALQMFEEGRPNPIGTIHVSCAEAYFGTHDLGERLRRLMPEMSQEDEAALLAALSDQRPGLAKTQGSEPEGDSRLGTGKG